MMPPPQHQHSARSTRRTTALWKWLLWLHVLCFSGVVLLFWRGDHVAVLSERLFQQEYDETRALAAASSANNNDGVHMLLALSGEEPGLLAEFEVAVKSILMNAPLDFALTIHVMADDAAHKALDPTLERMQLKTWRTRNPIYIQTYNVEPWIPSWMDRINAIKGVHVRSTKDGHTIGTYFRLFANEVVANSVQSLVYMDVDVVIMSNLGELWQHIDHKTYFQWGAFQCAGFLIVNTKTLPQMWLLLQQMDMAAMAKNLTSNGKRINDQLFFKAINHTHPEHVGLLPEEWDLSIANGVFGMKMTIVEKRPNVGMLHFNGGSYSTWAYFQEHQFATDLESPFGLVQYYAKLPWPWARFMAQSQIRKSGPLREGFPIQVLHGRQTAATRKTK